MEPSYGRGNFTLDYRERAWGGNSFSDRRFSNDAVAPQRRELGGVKAQQVSVDQFIVLSQSWGAAPDLSGGGGKLRHYSGSLDRPGLTVVPFDMHRAGLVMGIFRAFVARHDLRAGHADGAQLAHHLVGGALRHPAAKQRVELQSLG